MSSLYIDRKGATLKLNGSALVCYENEERTGTIPLAPIERMYIKGDVTLQASLLAKLGEQGIGIICLSGRKNTPTLFMHQPHNDAAKRVAQYQLSQQEDFCLSFAKKLIRFKLITQKNWLWQAANKRMDKKVLLVPKAQEIDELLAKVNQQPHLAALRGIEGRAASAYFTALSLYLPDSLRFQGRNRRPPRDPFNAVLSLTYTLLHAEAVLAAYGAGLDPYIGFYHSLDFGRESLACDLIEPLRPLVDNWLLGCFRQRILREEHFSTTENGCLLGKTGRVHFYMEYEKQIDIWRKMLTQNCQDLAFILKTSSLLTNPQRRDIEPKVEIKSAWDSPLERYFFNLRTLFDNLTFHF
ncbi:CRISPR-associated endonuclease Cas1 [Conservatibacter flavescens]|uniref:CRISPR-associated endonuclease Cas1 n=1 Tax=Conservatibacter flavescens TaxID=28161 RepID=A0A2M8S3A3_9PAST|nr:CRISPR-associated endonuclease Cas1 [Conservatibacter flavescens]PJG85621.1 CRISPR-associated endonuclease Cas1 [Conservatibacter flavescens]